MAKALRTKAKALPRVPQNREDAVWTIGRIGTLQREIAAHKAIADEAIRTAGEKFDNDVAELADELAQHEEGIRVYCEANRMKLTDDGKVKYHNFGTGTVKWRLRPPSVKLKGVELIIEQCRKLGFLTFLNEETKINKDAMLADPDKARLVAGVSISSEGEDFVVEPAELETAQPVKA
ncbi:host-nuclease inhibitor Gam family protein [Brucella sp. 2280]|uniref:host-nuclease inhibitor Gam family protein n=1 Tax=Brucella sp. 2280 TaxID=2592625 RepID=UPI001296EEE9|nr:host-nuclease inhibitor Gam family protein [Brucella sp. 2280]QGA56181.1 nuclease inhibitor protein [Brucella sp. 2280]